MGAVIDQDYRIYSLDMFDDAEELEAYQLRNMIRKSSSD